jgi:hypothetical protein
MNAQTGALIRCGGSPLQIHISADKMEDLDSAKHMAVDLIETTRAVVRLPEGSKRQCGRTRAPARGGHLVWVYWEVIVVHPNIKLNNQNLACTKGSIQTNNCRN